MMNLITEEPPAASTVRRQSRTARIDRSTIVLTVLSVVFALLVLLQMLPGSSSGADAAPAAHAGTVLTLPVFIAGALASVLAIAAVLIRATRGLQD